MPARRSLTAGMIREHFEFRQTITTVIADDPGHIEAAKAGMLAARREVEDQIGRDLFFAATFEPYIPPNAANTPTRMARAAAEAGVGPMAAVAGAIAGAGVEAMAGAGASFGLIDNGGDIALVSDRQVTIGIYAGASPLSSFGIADAVTVFSPDVALADAWATAVCNQITAKDTSVLDRLEGSGVAGVLAIIGDTVIRWGDLPPIVRARVDERLITAGRQPFHRPGS